LEEYYLDRQNRTRVGQYLTTIEGDFISECLQQEIAVHSILDVGGGTGRFAIPLHNKGYQVTITEVQLLPLRHLKAKSPHIDAVLTSRQARFWPIKGFAVDCVLAIEVPMVYNAWFWQECRRVLRPGGIVILSVLNARSYKGALYKMRWILKPFLSERGKRWATGRFYTMPARTVVQMLEAEGFRLCQAMGFNWLPAGRISDFSLIPLLATVEEKLRLRNLAFQSPWVILKASLHLA